MQFVGLSDIGPRRTRNEDAWFADAQQGLFIICDGMGGHRGGDVASAMAVELVREKFVMPSAPERIPEELRDAFLAANSRIWSAAQLDDSLKEMGTTITTAVIREQTAYVAHVGDSSLHLIRGGRIRKLTQDHTVADEMRRDGVMRGEEEKYRHVLTRALGVETAVEIDSFSFPVKSGDKLLFCTDGLGDVLNEEDILKAVKAERDLAKAAQRLLHSALSKGGSDNITLILVRL